MSQPQAAQPAAELTPEFFIERFNLVPLPVEGGMFARYYASAEAVPASALPRRYAAPKRFASAICYLHQPDTQSLLHRLKTDEIYHFYAGDPVLLLLLYPHGAHRLVTLGQDYLAGHEPFFVVPRGVWQGSCLVPGGRWAFVGCTMAPAYDDDDFELGQRAELLKQYPAAAGWIGQLT